MMKFLLKLAIAVLIANAGWRVGSAYLAFYKFEDAVRSTLQYRGTKSDGDIRKRIFELAGQVDIPLDDGLTMGRQNNHTIVDGSYELPVEVVPGYVRTFPFKVHLDIPTSTLP